MISVVLSLALTACGSKEPAVIPDGSASGTAANADAQSKEYTAEMLTKALPADNVQVTVEDLGLKVSMSNGYICFESNITDDETGKQVIAATYIANNDMYMKVSNPESGESSYMHAKFEDDTIITAKEGADIMSPEEFSVSANATVDYVDTIVEDGITYDTVRVISEDAEQADYYINIDTELVERIVIYSQDATDDSTVIVTFKVIDAIVLPEEFNTSSVKELSSTDMAMLFFTQVLMPFSEGTINDGVTSSTYTQDKVYNPAILNSTFPTDNIQFFMEDVDYGVAVSNGNILITEYDTIDGHMIIEETYCFGSDIYSRQYSPEMGISMCSHGVADADQMEMMKDVSILDAYGVFPDADVEYKETVVENGVEFDKVHVVSMGDESDYFINVNTGLIDHIILRSPSDSSEDVTVTFTVISDISLPDDFSSGNVEEVPTGEMYIPFTPSSYFDSMYDALMNIPDVPDMESEDDSSDEVTHFEAH